MEPEAGARNRSRYQVNVDFWQAIRGAELRLNVTRQDTCPNCRGKGYIEIPDRARNATAMERSTDQWTHEVQCHLSALNGTGKARTICSVCSGEGGSISETIKPASSLVRAMGKEFAWREKACWYPWWAPGDLYIIIRANDHPVFHREGDDIRLTFRFR